MLRIATLTLFACAACGTPPPGTNPDPMNATPTQFRLRISNIAPYQQAKSGAFNTRVGGTAPGALAPGDAYEVTFSAGRGQKLSFASMFGASNDWVFATQPGGIELLGDSAVPVSGDVTQQISLYDVGSEIDEEPGVGAHTGPNQGTSGDGPGAVDPVARVRRLGSTVMLTSGAMFTLPPVASMIRVTLTPRGRDFTLRIQNVSNDLSTLMTSAGVKPVRISPGVWALSTTGEPLFTEGMRDRALGLEAIAETGNPTELNASLRPLTGLATPISPGVMVVHTASAPLFSVGERDRGMGLERIAEDGYAAPLREALGMATGNSALRELKLFDTPVGRDTTGPARAGSAYEISFQAVPGDRLSFATMFGWSNDWFFATPGNGIALFEDDAPRFGSITDEVSLYDVGSELSEEPNVGPNTGPQQTAANTGPADTDVRVRLVTQAEYVPPVSHHLEISLVKP